MWPRHTFIQQKCIPLVVLLVIAVIGVIRWRNGPALKEIGMFALPHRNLFDGETQVVITMRQKLTTFLNASAGVILPGTNIKVAEEIFHRYASDLQVKCPLSKRLGNVEDGGWDICLYSSYNIRSPCLVYSFGINNDWSFDDAVVDTFNCTVRAFDPSMKVSDHRRGTGIWFYHQGLGGSDKVNGRGWQLRTLESFLKMFNETNETIDYLKMDIEYSEWEALDAILNSRPTVLSRVKQFGLETHMNEVFRPKSGTSVEDFIYYTGILRRLQDAGFYRWYWHYNHFGVYVSPNSKQNRTCCYEMVFINVNIPF